MPAKKSSNSSTASKKKSKTYIDLLIADHDKVRALFKRFEKTEDDDQKREIVETTILELKIHATIEEEIVYPAFRENEVVEEDMMDEADVEHEVAKNLIAELENMKPGDEYYDAKFTVLCEIIEHHAEEEEEEIFPEARKSKEIDAEDITGRVADRKQQLMQELGAELAEAK